MGSDHHIEVLLVEDDAGDAELIRIMLAGDTSFSFNVTHVNSLSSGLAHLKNFATDIILLDLFLPDSEGCEGLAMVRDCFPSTPTIILTGNHDETLAPQLVRNGAQDFLVKSSLSSGELVRAIRYAIQRHELTHELEKQKSEIDASHSRLHQIINDNADAIFVLDPNGIVKFANPAATRLFGRRTEDFPGVPFGYPIVVDRITELDIVRRDGRPCIAEMQVTWTDWEGQDALLATLRDITARKKVEAQLRQTQKLESLGVMAAGIAHDFNNLLAGVLGYGNLILDELEPDSSPCTKMKRLIESAERAAELSELMLAYTGHGLRSTLPLDINSLIQNMDDIIASIVPSAHKVVYNLAERSPVVDADPMQLRQVLVNIVLNASEAIGESNGTIELRSYISEVNLDDLKQNLFGDKIEPGAYACIAVKDSGCGIDEEGRMRIFDPFFTTKFTGRGLGLASASGIVRAHGGGFLVESTVGEGSTFTILFPPSSTATTETPVRKIRVGDWKGCGTILVVDDEESVRDSLKMTLERFGYDVLLAEDGEQAVEIYKGQGATIDASIIDITMPGIDGQETLEQIRKIRPDAQVVLSSGYARQGYSPSRSETNSVSQPEAYLQKPYRVTDLVDLLWRMLDEGEPESPATERGPTDEGDH